MSNLDKAILIARYVTGQTYEFFMTSDILTEHEKVAFDREYIITVLSGQHQWYLVEGKQSPYIMDIEWFNRLDIYYIGRSKGSEIFTYSRQYN